MDFLFRVALAVWVLYVFLTALRLRPVFGYRRKVIDWVFLTDDSKEILRRMRIFESVDPGKQVWFPWYDHRSYWPQEVRDWVEGRP